jgi:PAS domain S-box-containing protein
MVSPKRDTPRAAQMQDYLREHQDALHLVADAVPALVSFVDGEVRYAFVNEAYRDLFGLPPDAVAGRTLPEMIGQGYETVRAHVERALAGERVEFQNVIPYPTAGCRIMNGVYTPRFAADGSVLGYVGVVFDVTQRVEAERQVRQLTEAQARTLAELRAGLAEQRRLEERQRALYELSQELSKAAAPRDVALVAVSRAREVLGAATALVYAASDGAGAAQLVAGRCEGCAGSLALQACPIPLDAPVPLAAVIREREALWIPDPPTLRARYPELGGQLGVPAENVRAIAAVPLIAGGRLVGGMVLGFSEPRAFPPAEREFVVVVAEQCATALARAGTLEEERRLREQRERDAEQLAAAAELRERFVGMLGHDLRGPLTAILSTAQTLERKGALAPADMHAIRRIGGSASRMQRMIEQMLDLTRILHSGGLVLETEPSDLRRIVEDILAELRAVHPGVELQSGAQGDCRGEWDVDRLCQVVWNLVANAVRHGAAKAVEVRVDGTGDRVTLQVHNQGAPIPRDVLPSIFEPFWSGSKAPAKEGLGLGLYITREIVSAHGGEISVASSAEGTTFTVHLPRAVPLGARVMAGPPPDEPRDGTKG